MVTNEQMKMYLDGTTDRMVKEAKEYEVEQFRKAFLKGTDAGWRTYRRNVAKKVAEVNRITGVGIDLNSFMS